MDPARYARRVDLPDGSAVLLRAGRVRLRGLLGGGGDGFHNTVLSTLLPGRDFRMPGRLASSPTIRSRLLRGSRIAHPPPLEGHGMSYGGPAKALAR